MEYPIKEKWFGNKDVVAELQDFKVLNLHPQDYLDQEKLMSFVFIN